MSYLLVNERWLRRQQVAALSGFRLPAAALDRLPGSILAEIRSRTDVARRDPLCVPRLSYEQIRNLERYRLFGDFGIKPQRGRFVLIWKARRRGDTVLYSVENLFLGRLVAWMYHWGLTLREVLQVLQVGAAAVTINAPLARSVVVERGGRACGGVTTATAEQERELIEGGSELTWTFPLAYLGRRRMMPQLRKMLKEEPTVTRWRREYLPAQLTALQASESEELRA